MIKIEHLTKSYAGSDVKAVEDLSFTAEDGQIVGFVGPNGAGKSTTIKCLTGILPFSEGKITVDGFDIRSEKTYRFRCGREHFVQWSYRQSVRKYDSVDFRRFRVG